MTFSPEILWGVGIVVLLGALIWGVMRNRGRNRMNDPITEQATREQYKHPETYEQTAKELKRQVRPS